MKQELSSLQT